MFLSSQLVEISSRFPAHVQDIREFLLKEQLPVPSPAAIPQLLSRLGTDDRFRADVGSLTRAVLYQEREGIGYEDLLGILVVATAGTEQDLKSDAQDADIREMLRFLLQSRRSTFRTEAEEAKSAVEPEPREPVPAAPAQLNSEPVLQMRGQRSAAHSKDLELRPTESSVAVAEADSREPDDLLLPALFRSTGSFAGYAESEAPQWRGRSVWIIGLVCILLGLGVGLMIHRVAKADIGVRAAEIGPMIHRVVSAAKTHVGLRTAESSSARSETSGTIAPKESATENSNAQNFGPASTGEATTGVADRKADAREDGARRTKSTTGEAETPSVAEGGNAVQPAVSDHAPPTSPTTTAAAGPAVPVTVTKQVVTAFPSQSLDPADPMTTAAATKSTAQKASADVTPANVIFSPAAKYPAAASAARVEGEVTVRAVVDTQGKVVNAHVVSGPLELRDAAQEAVQRWRYRPLLYNGKPIAVTTVAIVDFRFAE